MTDAITMVATFAGAVFFIAGSVGLLRFPDLFSRLHALTKADNLGLGLIALGVAAQADTVAFAAKVGLVWLMTIIASAVVGHLIARDGLAHSAYFEGTGAGGDHSRSVDGPSRC